MYHPPMKRPWLAALLAAPFALAAAPARAQDAPPEVPPPAPPVQPVQPAPYVQPVQPAPYAQPVQPVQPAPYAQPTPYFPPPPAPYWPPPRYVASAPEEPERRGPMNWYGWQTLIAVAPIDIVMFASLPRLGDTAGTATFAAAFVARNLAPAVVHLAHGRVATAFASIGLHAATTATGVAIGYGLGIALEAGCKGPTPCRNSDLQIPPGPGYGAIAGSISGTILTLFFAHRQRLTWTASAPAAPAGPTWAFAPYAAPKGAGLAAAGTF